MNSSSAAQTNSTLLLAEWRNEITCYALPYGALGCVSHVWTIYTLAMNIIGRNPKMPWKKQKHKWVSVAIGIITLIGTLPLGIINITRCSGNRNLVLLSGWMIMTSAAASLAPMLAAARHLDSKASGVRTINRSNTLMTLKNQQFEMVLSEDVYDNHALLEGVEAERTNPRPGRSVREVAIAYLIFAIWISGCGMGLYSCIEMAKTFWNTEHSVQSVTLGFLLPPCIFLTLAGWGYARSCGMFGSETIMKIAVTFAAVFFVCTLIYMDWMIAAVSGNWVGKPPKGKVSVMMYWTYFALKRLPFLTF